MNRVIFSLLVFAGCFLPGCSPRGLGVSGVYQQVGDWPRLPDSLVLGNPTGIGIDSGGHVIVFHRGRRKWPVLLPMPHSLMQTPALLVLDGDKGTVLSRWGDHRFVMPHGLTVDAQDNIWVTDVGLHQVFKFTHDGRCLLTLGMAGVPGNDSAHFNRPTGVAVAQDGSFYVSDGYINSRVVKFSPEGKYLFEWGKKGDKPGEFNVPHGICLDDSGNVYVADRENRRIQIFTAAGSFLRQFSNPGFGYITALAFDGTHRRLIAVDDDRFLGIKHNGSEILILGLDGKLLDHFGQSAGSGGPACWYHTIAIGKDGALYVGDILGDRLQKFMPRQDPAGGRYSK